MPDSSSQDPNQIDISLSLLGDSQALNSLVSELKSITAILNGIKAQNSQESVRLSQKGAEALSQTSTGTAGVAASRATAMEATRAGLAGASRSHMNLSPDAPVTAGGIVVPSSFTRDSTFSPIGGGFKMPKAQDLTSEQMYGGTIPQVADGGAGVTGSDGAAPDFSNFWLEKMKNRVQNSSVYQATTKPLRWAGQTQPAQWGKSYVDKHFGDIGGPALAAQLWNTHAFSNAANRAEGETGVAFTPGNMQRVGEQYGGSSEPGFLGGARGNLFGSQLLSESGRAGLRDTFRAVKGGIETQNISVRELGQVQGEFRGMGYSQPEVNHMTDRIKKMAGDGIFRQLGSTSTWAPLVDQMRRHGRSSMDEVVDSLKKLPAAAKAAKMSVEEFNQSLNSVANFMETQGSTTFRQGLETTTTFSRAMKTPPETLQTLMGNPLFAGQMMGKGYLPWEMGSAPPGVLADNTLDTFSLLRGMLPTRKKITRHDKFGETSISARSQQDQWIAHLTGISPEHIGWMEKQRKFARPRARLEEAGKDYLTTTAEERRDPSKDASLNDLKELMNNSGFNKDQINRVLGKHGRRGQVREMNDILGNLSKNRQEDQGKLQIEFTGKAARMLKFTDESKRRVSKGLDSSVGNYLRGPNPQPIPYGKP